MHLFRVTCLAVLLKVTVCTTPLNLCPMLTPCTCYNHGFLKSDVVVDCQGKRLIGIPSLESIGAARELIASSNRIHRLRAYPFKGFNTSLIDLSHNSISEMHEFAFSGLENSLTTLKLQFNRFTNVPTKSLRRLKQLKELNLDNNVRLETLKNFDFKGLENLEKLSLMMCRISVIEPSAFIGLDSLKELVLYENNLQKISSATFDPLHRLEKLDLGFNGLQTIPAGAFKNLMSLSLSMNNFSSQSSFDANAFDGVKNTLEFLTLTHCRMTSIPQRSLVVLGKLKQMNLAGNQIQEINEEDFHGLSALEHLTLDLNLKIDFTHKSFSLVGKTLRYLSMRDMGLKQLPLTALQDLIALELLDVSGNSFDSFGKDAFRGICATRLEISHSDVRVMDPKAFDYTRNGLNLNLKGNLIQNTKFLQKPCKFSEVNIDLKCDCDLYDLLQHRQLEITGKCRLRDDLENLPINSDEYEKISKDRCAESKHNIHLEYEPEVCPNFNQSETGNLSPSRCLSKTPSSENSLTSLAPFYKTLNYSFLTVIPVLYVFLV